MKEAKSETGNRRNMKLIAETEGNIIGLNKSVGQITCELRCPDTSIVQPRIHAWVESSINLESKQLNSFSLKKQQIVNRQHSTFRYRI